MTALFEIDCDHDIFLVKGKSKRKILAEMQKNGAVMVVPIRHTILDTDDEHADSSKVVYECSSGLTIKTSVLDYKEEHTVGMLKIKYDHFDPRCSFGYLVAKQPLQQFANNRHVFYSYEKKQSILWHIGNFAVGALTFGRKSLRPDVDIYGVSRHHAAVLYKSIQADS